MTIWVVDLLVRGAFVCVIGSLAALAARQQAAALRALVWSATLVALLALPLVSGLAPSFEVPVLSPSEPLGTTGRPAVSARQGQSEATLQATGSMNALARLAPLGTGGYLAPPSAAAPPAARPSRNLVGFLVGLWITGVGVVLARVLVGLIGTVRLRAGAVPLRGTEVAGQLSNLAKQLGMSAPPDLLASEHLKIPVAVQFLRPTIIVPVEFVRWPRQRRAAVLLHETAHLQRYDCWVQLAARIAVALHWINPLAWLALSRLWTERECACDDAVLRGGLKPSDYATHLLAVAAPAASLPAHAAAAFARRRQLPDRVRAILNPSTGRQSPTRRTLVSVTALSLVFLFPVAVAQPVAMASGSPPDSGDPAVVTVAAVSPKPAASALATAAQQELPSIEDLVRMRIHGVTPGFIEAMTELADDVDVDTLVQLRIHGVTPDYARGMRSALGENLGPQDLVQGRVHGVTPVFAAGMADQLGADVPFQTLTQMRIHGVSLEFFEQVQALLPHEEIESDDLVRMRIHGVSPAMIRELNDKGHDDLTVDELVRIKIHGFDRVLRRRPGGQG